jgi:hypothetical protein
MSHSSRRSLALALIRTAQAFVGYDVNVVAGNVLTYTTYVSQTDTLRVAVCIGISAIILLLTATYAGVASWVLAAVKRGRDATALSRVSRAATCVVCGCFKGGRAVR